MVEEVTQAPVNDKQVVQSPPDNPSPEHLHNVDQDNLDSMRRDREGTDEPGPQGDDPVNVADDPVRRAVTGANAGLDNDPANISRDGPRPTAYSDMDKAGQFADPNPVTGQPGKMDSFGRVGDRVAPRPQVTPDLAEPLHDAAAASAPPMAADAGETTARLHAGMRATGAKQYGLIQEDQDASASSSTSSSGSSSGSAPSSLGEVTDREEAVELIKEKTSRLHDLVHGIEDAASAPVHAIEHLIAEIKYLLSVTAG